MQWLGTESKTNWRLLIPYSGTLGRRSRESSTILRALYDFYYGTLRLYFLLYLYVLCNLDYATLERVRSHLSHVARLRLLLCRRTVYRLCCLLTSQTQPTFLLTSFASLIPVYAAPFAVSSTTHQSHFPVVTASAPSYAQTPQI